MKVLFLTFCLVAGAFARSAVQQDVLAEGPACPIEDPLIRDSVAINVTVDPIVKLEEGSIITNLNAVGLSTLRYKIDLNALLLTATFEVTIPSVDGSADFTASGYVDARPFSQSTIPSGNLTGGGLGKLRATNVVLKGRASLFINIIGNKVQISNLNLETVSFDTINIDLSSTLIIGGSPVDWEQLSSTLKANFDKELADNKNAITEKIRGAANGIVGKYTLAELIDLIGGGGGGEDPEC